MADVQLSSRATRVEDYLNDKLQNTADLEGLDILLENVQTQQELLKQQVAPILSMIEYLLMRTSSWKQRKISRKVPRPPKHIPPLSYSKLAHSRNNKQTLTVAYSLLLAPKQAMMQSGSLMQISKLCSSSTLQQAM